MNRACFVVLFVASLSICIPSFAQDTSAVESIDVLQISGEISYEDDPIEEVRVQLFEGNKVIEEQVTKGNGKFKFTLYSQEHYTLQFSKKGYYTKRVSVNTRIPADFDDFQKFQFDMGMTLKTDVEYDPYLVEYPSALISFEEKKQEFVFDKGYTESYFEEIEASK